MPCPESHSLPVEQDVLLSYHSNIFLYATMLPAMLIMDCTPVTIRKFQIKYIFLIIVALIMMSPHTSRTVVTALYVSCDQNGFQASFFGHCPFPPLVSFMIAQA